MNKGITSTGKLKKGIIGAIIGDIVGSRFEWHNHRYTDFELVHKDCIITDDTVMTIAIADWLIAKNMQYTNKYIYDLAGDDLSPIMSEWGNKYPRAGYGAMFFRWLNTPPKEQKPYNSFGNGSGMRVSPVGFYAKSIEETLILAKESAEVTHNHPEGIKGAQAIASAIYLARTGKSKKEIKDYIEKSFGYDLNRTCDEIRPYNQFDETCQGSCPEAIISFLESDDFESAIRLAVSLGGDSDTIACMTGGIAAAYYGVPEDIVEKIMPYLPYDIKDELKRFDAMVEERMSENE